MRLFCHCHTNNPHCRHLFSRRPRHLLSNKDILVGYKRSGFIKLIRWWLLLLMVIWWRGDDPCCVNNKNLQAPDKWLNLRHLSFRRRFTWQSCTDQMKDLVSSEQFYVSLLRKHKSIISKLVHYWLVKKWETR